MKQFLLEMYFQFFALCAKIFLYRHTPTVIWVTGSIGKTSARMLISEILTQSFPEKTIYTSSKNFNGELWMSLSVLGISDYTPNVSGVLKTFVSAVKIAFFGKKQYDVIFLEYGIDHVGEMAFMLSVVQPELAIVTKIDKVHSSQFQSTDVTAKEKYQLLQQTQSQAYLNIDDSYAFQYASSISAKHRYFATDIDSQKQDIDVRGQNYSVFEENNLLFSSVEILLDGEKKTILTSNSLWQENIWYFAIWYDMVEYLSQKWYQKSFFADQKNTQISLDFTLQPSRFWVLKGVWDSILIDSTYNAAPESMKVVLKNAYDLCQKVSQDRIFLPILWEMRELWPYSQQEHENLAEFVFSLSQEVWWVWEDMKYFAVKFESLGWKYFWFKNSQLLWKALRDKVESSLDKYFIVVKWSQNTIFLEESVKALLLDQTDEKNLCRQEKFWMEKKNTFFQK